MFVGKTNDGEIFLETANRKCHEELVNEVIFDSNLIELVMEFDKTNINKVIIVKKIY